MRTRQENIGRTAIGKGPLGPRATVNGLAHKEPKKKPTLQEKKPHRRIKRPVPDGIVMYKRTKGHLNCLNRRTVIDEGAEEAARGYDQRLIVFDVPNPTVEIITYEIPQAPDL